MRTIIKLPLLLVILLTTFTSLSGFAQDKKKKPQALKKEQRHKMHVRDSLMRSFNRSDTSINSLLQRVEQYANTFNQINNDLEDGLDTADVSVGIGPVFKRINKID